MLQVMIRVKNAIRKNVSDIQKNMEEEGCSSILQYFGRFPWVILGVSCFWSIKELKEQEKKSGKRMVPEAEGG